MRNINVGVIGCGAIGSVICRAIDTDEISGHQLKLGMKLKVLIDTHPERIEALCKSLKKKPVIIKSDASGLDEILDEVDLVIECASVAAVREFIIPALQKGKEVMILSVGALLCDPTLFEEIERIARERRCNVYIPSGAVAGLDGLKSGVIGGMHAVALTTRKPPLGFEGNEYVRERGIDLHAITDEKPLFVGSAREAVKHFPENVNVAASISLAGIGPEATKVKIVADPAATENIHEIEAKGEFGHLFVRVENVPSVANPKTSYLAALSAIATLKRISDPIRVGT
ncbi:MAG: aspartate dehydrogenase [Methanophagales archaeon ANME-1-THS]|nr:MAG: aspartate dehydrogenase [Methanophagales archaeon ANME-1-THS]